MIAKTISIITITLNNLDGLKRTHSSIKQQKSDNYEWIVIDGASQDGTVDYLKNTQSQWISEPDKGLYDAMNKGIERAQGHYILFLNAGDTFAAHDILEHIGMIAEKTPMLIYGDSLENAHYKKTRSYKTIKRGLFTHHQAIFYNRKALGTTRYDQSYKIAADYDLTARFLTQNPEATYIKLPICDFKSGGVSQTNADLGRREQYQIRKHLKLCSPLENIIITALQALIWRFRIIAPTLYWRLKSSGNSARANAQNQNQPPHPKNHA